MQKTIIYKNANISYTDTGKGAAIVLLHGFLESTKMWKDIVPYLSKKNRVICIDLLGHGKSDCLGYIHTMELFAETVFTVLKKLRIRKCFLVGHSLGGYVALAFAEKYPENIKGLCLMNSTSNEDDDKRKLQRIRANKMVQTNFEAMVKMSFVNLFGSKIKDLYKKEFETALLEALQTSLQGYIAAQEGMRVRPNRNYIMANNTFKKLMIIGRKDPILKYENLLEEANRNNVEKVIFSGGHMSHIEDKVALIQALKNFVEGCSL